MTQIDSTTAPQRRSWSSIATVIHLVLAPLWLLLWYGIGFVTTNVSGPWTPDMKWRLLGAFTVFGVGCGLWIWQLRALLRWSRKGLRGRFPTWCYPLLGVLAAWLLFVIGFGIRSAQFNHRGL